MQLLNTASPKVGHLLLNLLFYFQLGNSNGQRGFIRQNFSPLEGYLSSNMHAII